METRLTADEHRAIFETVWRTIRDEYYDPSFGGLDWQAIGNEYRQKLATVQDDDTFWRDVLNPMLWELGVSHLTALPPELATLIDPMTFAAGSLGIDVRLLDGRAVVFGEDRLLGYGLMGAGVVLAVADMVSRTASALALRLRLLEG